jgi:hypothetical protein
MNTQKLQPSFLLTALIILLFAGIRIAFPNFDKTAYGITSMGAIALFGGTMFRNKGLGIALPVMVLLLSDLVINKFIYHTVFYEGWVWVYVAFALMALVGRLMTKKITIANIISSAIVTTLTHWVFTSVAYWFGGGVNVITKLPVTKDWKGLVAAHTQAIPFEWPLLAGTLIYSFIMFGVFYFVKKQKPAFAYAK